MRHSVRRSRAVAVACAIFAITLFAPAASAAPAATVASSAAAAAPGRHADGTNRASTEVSCPQSAFDCVTLTVPRDHFSAAGSTDSIHVTFAIHRATGPRLGTWVTAVGGPGYSGLAASDYYMSGMDPKIVASYDLVFFDQRGVGLSEPLACPVAATAFYLSPADARDPDQAGAVMAASRAFASACVRESGVDPADLPFFSTRQAVEDLEAFRRYLGVDRLDLYGESYGTQYVQTYALAHPDHVRSLILDGPVDLTLPITETWPEAVRAMDRTLADTLAACDADPACRHDVGGGPALAAYDRLASRLESGRTRVRFPLASGRWAARTLSATNLETVALNALYGQWDRMELQRVVASSTRGNLVPALRLLYSDVAVDPETLAGAPDPSWSDAAYYAIECTDYAIAGDTPDARARSFLQAGWDAGVGSARLGRVMFDDLPCAYWPARPASDVRPAPIVAHDYAFLVLVADADPITPIEGAERIVGRSPGARLVVQTGGPHVLYGRGVACVDDVVTAMLVTGAMPPEKTTCDGDLTDPYLPLPPATRAAATDPLVVATAVDDWMATLPAYAWWDGSAPGGAAGCDLGGRFTFTPKGELTRLTFRSCTLTPGLPLSGTGSVDGDGAVRLWIASDLGSLRYFRNADGALHVVGTWRGRPVDIRG